VEVGARFNLPSPGGIRYVSQKIGAQPPQWAYTLSTLWHSRCRPSPHPLPRQRLARPTTRTCCTIWLCPSLGVCSRRPKLERSKPCNRAVHMRTVLRWLAPMNPRHLLLFPVVAGCGDPKGGAGAAPLDIGTSIATNSAHILLPAPRGI